MRISIMRSGNSSSTSSISCAAFAALICMALRQMAHTPYCSASALRSACAASPSGSMLLITSTKGLPVSFISAITRASAST